MAWTTIDLTEKAITLPDGYNGHTRKFVANPIEFDGNCFKLKVADSSYLFRWIDADAWIAEVTEQFK